MSARNPADTSSAAGAERTLPGRGENGLLLEIAGRIASIGGWSVDLVSGQVFWSDQVCDIHEERRGTSPALEQGLDYYVEESRPRIAELFRDCAELGTPFDEELQITTARGRRRWVRVIGEAVRDASGRPVSVQGAFQDITSQRAREEALATSEAELQAVFNQSYLFQGILSLHGALLSANDLSFTACGYRREDVLGQPFWDTPWWDCGDEVRQSVREAVQRARGGEVVQMNSDYRVASGQIRRTTFTVSRVTRADGEPICLVVSGLDVTERTNAERALADERRFLEAMLDNVSEGIVACDAQGMLSVFNRATREIHALPEIPLSPEHWSEYYSLFAPDGVTRLGKDEIPLYRALHGEKVLGAEMVIAPHGAPARTVLCSGQPILSGEGEQLGAVVVMHDITDRKVAEQALERAHRAQRMLSRCNEALIRAETEQGLLDAICRIAVDIGGYHMAWVGLALDDADKSIRAAAHAGAENGYLADIRLSWHEDSPAAQGPAGRSIRGGRTVVCGDIREDPMFAPWRGKALAHGFIGVICLPLRHEQQSFGLLGLYSSTPLSPSPDELQLLEDLAANLAFGIRNLRSREDKARIQAAVLELASGVSGASGEFFAQLVTSMASALGACGAFVVRHLPGPPVAGETLAGILDGERIPGFGYLLSGTPCESFGQHAECVIPSGSAAAYPATPLLRDMGIEAYVGRRLDAPDGTPIGHICVLYREPLREADLACSMLRIFAARAAAELQRELTEQKLREQASLLDKASDAILVRSIDHRILFWNRGAERLYGWAPEEAVGCRVDALLYDSPALFQDATRQVLDCGHWQGRVVQRHRDGRRIVVEAHWTLVRDAYGEPQSILAINTDISERIALEDKLQQSQRLEAIGQLTGGVAHDFNNLLTVILGSAELLTEKLAADPRLLTLAEMIGKAAQKGADLTHRLLAVARRQALDPRAVDVNELVLSMTPLLQRTLPEDVELCVKTVPGLSAALVDPSELEGALLNLSLNARDAMPGGGKLMIETGEVVLDDDFARRNVDVAPGRYLMIAVSDTGCGIPQENIGRVFDPFFSTKEFGKGTGLGLSMVYGFIQQSRGHVRIYSEVGQGTSVRMYLPHAPAGSADQPEVPEDEVEPRGSEHILMVEDDALVRRHVEHQLRELGYRVTAVSSGPAALECLDRMADIDLLFTDVIMPGGLNGPQLAAAARSARPGLPVLYTSGYTENAIVHHGRLDPGVHLLNKPYRRNELACKIRQVLAAPVCDGERDE